MKKYIIYLLIVTVGLVSLNSCDEMNSFHEPYLEEGPIVYRAQPDSLYLHSGDERIEVNWELSIDTDIVKSVVTVDNDQSYEFPIERQNEVDLFTEIISGLTEGSHEITVQNIDDKGNSSLPVSKFVDVFGETYRSGLEARKINATTKQADSLSIAFGVSKELQRTSEFNYFSATTGEETVIVTQQEDTSVVLKDVDFTKVIQYRTYYVPNDSAIDEFPSDWVEYQLSENTVEVLSSVALTPIIGGVKLNWSNPLNLDFSFDVMYTLGGVEKKISFSSNSSEESKLVSGLDEGTQDIIVVVTGSDRNGVVKSFSATVQAAAKLDHTGWSVIDDFSRPDYPASNFIDGDYATFWHTPNAASVSPDGTTPPYPHNITVDLGAPKTIASIKLFRRLNNGTGPTLQEIWLSSDNVTYTKVGETGKIPNNNGVVIAIDEQTAQYVKYIALEGPNFFTHMGEMELYGLE